MVAFFKAVFVSQFTIDLFNTTYSQCGINRSNQGTVRQFHHSDLSQGDTKSQVDLKEKGQIPSWAETHIPAVSGVDNWQEGGGRVGDFSCSQDQGYDHPPSSAAQDEGGKSSADSNCTKLAQQKMVRSISQASGGQPWALLDQTTETQVLKDRDISDCYSHPTQSKKYKLLQDLPLHMKDLLCLVRKLSHRQYFITGILPILHSGLDQFQALIAKTSCPVLPYQNLRELLTQIP